MNTVWVVQSEDERYGGTVILKITMKMDGIPLESP